MTYYDDRRRRDRYSRPSSYVQEPYYRVPHHGAYDMDVVRRHDGSNDSIVEEVHRDFPPGDYGYPHPRRSRVTTVQEGVRRAHSINGDRGQYYDGASYRPHEDRRSRRHHDDRRDRRSRYPLSYSSSSSRSPPRRRKSLGEQALGALGLGGAVGAVKHHDRNRGRSHSRHRGSYSYSPSPTRSRSRHHHDKSEQRVAQAVRAALTAGAAEAFRLRKEPGDWKGEKGKRILTAALAAGGTDGLLDRDPDNHSKRHVIESTLAGLAANHFVNGPREGSGSGSRSRARPRDRSRSRSHSHSRVKQVATTGLLAAAGKELFDRVRSKSRGRDRSSSRDSYDSRHRGSKKRSKSVSEYITKGMAALGLSEGADADRDRDRRRRHRDRPSRYSDYSDDDYDSDYYDSRRHGGSRYQGRQSREVGRVLSANESIQSPPYSITKTATAAPTTTRSGATGEEGYGFDGSHDCAPDSDSDLGDSSDEKKKRNKLRKDTLLTTGLATVATIHAAHSAYRSMEKRKERMQQLKEGEITPEEARKKRMKANVMDATSIGLAALGIKGAIAEWKDVDEKRKEHRHLKEECALNRAKRELRRARSQEGAGSNRRSRRDDDYGSPDDNYWYHDGNPYGYEYGHGRSPSADPPMVTY